MKKNVHLIVMALLLCLTGCAGNVPEEGETVPHSVPTTQPAATEPVKVSPLANEDFLVLDDSSSPRECPVEIVMLHFTSAVMLDRENPFDYDLVRGIFQENRLGIHYIIDRDGKIYCFVPESRAAWHAGRGSYQDEKYTDNMNQYSIGIELMAIGSEADMSIYLHSQEYAELAPEHIGFTAAQYDALASLVADICSRRDIPTDKQHIIGHQTYNPAKNDPGELFDWDGFMSILKEKQG